MNSNAQLWIKTLKVGNFPQGYGKLGSPDCGYCPLGVACVLFECQTGKKLPISCNEYDGKSFDQEGFEVVQEWLGMKDPYGYMGEKSHYYKYITVLNDTQRYDFPQIAKIILKHKNEIFH